MKKLVSVFIVLLTLINCCFFVNATEDEGKYTVGEIVEFGSYPQTEITDEALIQELDAIDEPRSHFYGYYRAEPRGPYGDADYVEDEQMMCYKDVTLNGEKYRGILILSYRPMRTSYSSDELYSCQDSYYSKGEWYWFKYEPLKWRVFDGNKGLALCEKIIDAQPYNSIYKSTYTGNDYEHINFSTTTEYANNFSSGSLRDWLNEDFLTTAFNEEEQSLLTDFTVDTCFEDGSCGTNRGAAVDVQVGLLTYKQAKKAEADEVKNEFVFDLDSQKTGEAFTDYSKIQGCSGSSWWLVTPCLSSTDLLYTIGSYPQSGAGMHAYFGSNCANFTSEGVRPVISLENILEEKSNSLFSASENDHNSPNIGLIFGIIGGAVIAVGAGIIIIKKKKSNN